MCSDKQKKYRKRLELKKNNNNMEYYDILRGLKKTTKKSQVINRENLKFNNKAEQDFILSIGEFCKRNFSSHNSYFLTITMSEESSLNSSAEKMLRLFSIISRDVNFDYFGIPEKNKSRYGYHYHFLINIDEFQYKKFESLLYKFWCKPKLGGYHITRIDRKRSYYEYLTKFFKSSSKNSLLPNYDGIISNMNLDEIDNYNLYHIGKWVRFYTSKRVIKDKNIIYTSSNIVELKIFLVSMYLSNYVSYFESIVVFIMFILSGIKMNI